MYISENSYKGRHKDAMMRNRFSNLLKINKKNFRYSILQFEMNISQKRIIILPWKNTQQSGSRRIPA